MMGAEKELFGVKQLEWLSEWAGRNLAPFQIAHLADALVGSNILYERDSWLAATFGEREATLERINAELKASARYLPN